MATPLEEHSRPGMEPPILSEWAVEYVGKEHYEVSVKPPVL